MPKNNQKNVKRKYKSTDSSTVAPKPKKSDITVDIHCLDGNIVRLQNLTPEDAARAMAEVKAFYLLRYGIDFNVAARQGVRA